ncbi:MAG TPA: rRNA maturation RNase YbeY [Candidatus Omnitrophota bacterium]|nr:rRNA maturation RNase YbeY [Candidatus Omnitrophota bacterium]HPS37380.1 rRNA maturation RNase YbeY [Candidatus Omnitrophota bacterium]
MAFEISIHQECPRIKVSEITLKKIAGKILRDLGFKKAVLSVLLVGSERMRVLNQRYLRHARTTDVLAFSELDPAARAFKAKRVDFLGDIALCLSTIRAQAAEYDHTFEEELHYCLCHGILHLLGYKDKTRAASKKMHQKQKQLLSRVDRNN